MTAPESKASKRILRGRQREEQSLALRLTGATYRQIGSELGITEQGAHAAVMRALKRLNERIAEGAEEVRQLELGRLDALLEAVWPRATMGKVDAVDRALKIMARRAALLGLDNIKQHLEVSVHDAEEARQGILGAIHRIAGAGATPEVDGEPDG